MGDHNVSQIFWPMSAFRDVPLLHTSMHLSLTRTQTLSCRPWELRTGTAESPLQTFPRSEHRPPAAALTCLTTVQILYCSDRLAVHHPDERLWSSLFVSRAVTGETLQISQGRWITESNVTWGQLQRGGQAVYSYNFFKSSVCLRHGTWCFCLAFAHDCTESSLRDSSWNSSGCQGPAAQPMDYIWISQL